MLDDQLSHGTEPLTVKRGRGRPPGSLNKPRQPPLSPEQADALRRRLAVDYAEAVVAEANAIDRKRAAEAEIRAHFGKTRRHVMGELVLEAQRKIDDGPHEESSPSH